MKTAKANDLFEMRPSLLHLCWSGEGVELAAWDAAGRRLRGDEGSHNKTAGEIRPAAFPDWLRRWGAERGACRMIWTVLKEPLPLIDRGKAREPGCLYEKGNPGRRIILPEWMRRCWEALPLRLHPTAVLSGVRLLEASLREWEPLRQPGEGFYFTLQDRVFLFASGEEEQLFLRLARREQSEDGRDAVFAEGWFRQTNFLYRERKGCPLRRLLLPGPKPEDLATGLPSEMEVCWNTGPPDWPDQPQSGPEETALAFLHEQARLRWTAEAVRLRTPTLDNSVARRMRDGGLKAGAALFLLGWVLAVVSACHHAEGPGRETELALALEKEKLRWKDNHAWDHAVREREAAGEAPFRTVGAVIHTHPREVQLRRIHLEEAAEPGLLHFFMEGNYKGENASERFRKWMRDLRASGPVDSVRNLRFYREKEGLRFAMEGSATAKEVRP